MRITSVREVELTAAEEAAKDRFEEWLNEGRGIAEAVSLVRYPATRSGVTDLRFWRWLGNQEVEVPVVDRPGVVPVPHPAAELEDRLMALRRLAEEVETVDFLDEWTADPDADRRRNEARIAELLQQLALETALLWAELRAGRVNLPARSYSTIAVERTDEVTS